MKKSICCMCNFKSRYPANDLLCNLCEKENDNKPHILRCEVLMQHIDTDEVATHKVNYDDIFKEPSKHKAVTVLIAKLLKIKNQLDPSTCSCKVLKNSFNLHVCTASYSSGNK